MARPQKEGLDYFPHDVDLSKNDEIGELEILYGNDGYAVYLKILERIYKKGDKLGISAAETIQILSRNCNVSVDRLKEILDKAVKIGLFSSVEYKQGFLISDEITRRMKPVFDKREKMQKKYEKGISAAETPPETTIVKESKVKESREEKDICAPKAHVDTPEPTETPKEETKDPAGKKAKEAEFDAFCDNVVAFLNTKTGREYSAKSQVVKDLLRARFNEGRSAYDCRLVIVSKCRDWIADEKMAKYLRITTLFNKSKFEEYLQEAKMKVKEEQSGEK